MRIALFHGWRLSGSGSNEYTRYLARSLSEAGHQVQVLCREPDPERFRFVDRALEWTAEGGSREIFDRSGPGSCLVHRLPHGETRPVLVTDKQRAGPVKPFINMTDRELHNYRELTGRAVRAVLSEYPVDILHANHMVLQPTVAADVCGELGIPFIIYPHGSAIEYTLRPDERYRRLAGEAIQAARGLIIGSREVRQRLYALYPGARKEIEDKSRIIGVGVDTSLFAPVARRDRMNSIRRLADLNPGGGKRADQLSELHRRLEHGELEAVGDYQQAYARTRPDEDCPDHLLRIPWETGRIMLYVGALTVGKGLHRLIVSLPQVLEKVPRAQLVVVGSGAYREVLEALVYAISRGDQELLRRMVSMGYDLEETHMSGPWSEVEHYLKTGQNTETVLSAGRDFTEHVHFTGRLPHSQLRYLFPCCDLAVFPSIIAEAYPLVLMESLSNGVLPAASYFSGFAEGLDALVETLGEQLVERLRLPTQASRVVAGMADRLASLLSEDFDDDLSTRLHRQAVQNYDWSIRAGQMVQAYSVFLRK